MNLPDYLTPAAVHQFIASALAEDVGEGDHSTLGAVPDGLESKAKLLVKDNGMLAGVSLAQMIFSQFDARLQVDIFKHDGDLIKKGDIAFTVSGPARSILTTERLVLNCMQRMSGIATRTDYLCSLINGTNTRLLDTRKTTPNFRMMEKWAVAIGGGKNHRFALYDMIMLKDNHNDMAGGIVNAIRNTKAYLRKNNKALRIEIETRTIAEVEEVLREGGVDVIMLDNMTLQEMKSAVSLIGGKFETEASGGITELTMKDVAACGVDYISVGVLTHSAKSLDLSLKVIRD